MSAVHVHRVTVRFGDCDPAGILYYPRFFDLFHQAMETWFDEALGVPYRTVLMEWKRGVPTARAECDYRAPVRFGETVRVELRVEHLGTSSIRFGYLVVGPDDALRAEGRTACVFVDLDPASPTWMRPVPWPDSLRAAMRADGAFIR